jgi:hypothetical protein
LIHNGKIPIGKVVMHKCDVRNCINPEHLQIGTQSENIADAKKKNRMSKGKNHKSYINPESILNGQQLKCAKLTNSQADDIRKEYIPRIVSTRKLAKKYNVSQGCICFIIKNKTYKNSTYERIKNAK